MTRTREKNIDDEAIDAIVSVLDGWSGKLTWELLIDAIEKRTRRRYTRQALHRYERIHLAFVTRKTALAGGSAENYRVIDMAPELKAALEQVERLKGENQRLKAEQHRLLEQFARWAYNAHSRNLTKEFLDTPLPKVDRERTDVTKLKPVGDR